jgi:hypothetical protein
VSKERRHHYGKEESCSEEEASEEESKEEVTLLRRRTRGSTVMFGDYVPVIIHHNSFGPGSNLGLETIKNPSRPRRKGSFFAPANVPFARIKIRNQKSE